MAKADKSKYKTKAYYESLGYEAGYMEYYRNWRQNGKLMFSKNDILGADGYASNETEFILWNSVTGRNNIARNRKKFLAHRVPPAIQRVIVVWSPGDKIPEIVEVKDE